VYSQAPHQRLSKKMSSTGGTLAFVFSVYRRVLRTHRNSLPPPLRPVGDKYVKEEFASHLRGTVTNQQWREFLTEWMQYCSQLERSSDVPVGSGDIPDDVLNSMTADQRQKLEQLKMESRMLGAKLLKKPEEP
jgi:hypothetical protein